MTKASATGTHYLVGPGWDFAFIINAPWILVAFAHLLFREGLFPDVDEFRHFYITLPHRFITLGLVFLDRDRFSERPLTFLSLPLGFLVVVLAAGSLGAGVFLDTDTLLCIITIDYVWNSYHFASQHYGVTRIYGRKAGGGRPQLERAILVPVITWSILTAANWTLVDGALKPLFVAVDGIALTALLALLAVELGARTRSVPKLSYLVSVTILYGGFLVCSYFGLAELRLGFLVASGYFHAVEYLGIVHFYVKGKQRGGGFRGGFFLRAAPIWSQVVVLFALAVGTLALLSKGHLPVKLYLVIITVASFCHYAYDGMIWKLRKPSVAKPLGAESSA